MTTKEVMPDEWWGKPCWEPALGATFYAVTGYGSASAIADGVDAVKAFVSYLEVHTPGTSECVSWPDVDDADGDGHDDEFEQVTAGMPVCWNIFPKTNLTVKATKKVQIYMAYVNLFGDTTSLLDTRLVYFVVPPDVSDPIVE